MLLLLTVTLALPLASRPGFALTNSAPAESAEFEANVFISSEGRDESGDTVPAFCNAAVISPKALVTAAHCVKDAQVMGSFSLTVELGSYRYVKKPDGRVVRVGYAPYFKETRAAQFFFPKALSDRIARSGYSASIGPSEDVALVTLTEPLPLKEGFVLAVPISQADFRGILGSVVSYWPTVVTINPFEEMSADTKRQARLDRVSWTSGYFDSRSASRVQQGDSGAPLFVRVGSSWFLAGAVKGEARTLFGSWDVYSPLGTHACGLAQQLRDAAIASLLCR